MLFRQPGSSSPDTSHQLLVFTFCVLRLPLKMTGKVSTWLGAIQGGGVRLGVQWQNHCFGDHYTDVVYVSVEALEP